MENFPLELENSLGLKKVFSEKFGTLQKKKIVIKKNINNNKNKTMSNYTNLIIVLVGTAVFWLPSLLFLPVSCVCRKQQSTMGFGPEKRKSDSRERERESGRGK